MPRTAPTLSPLLTPLRRKDQERPLPQIQSSKWSVFHTIVKQQRSKNFSQVSNFQRTPFTFWRKMGDLLAQDVSHLKLQKKHSARLVRKTTNSSATDTFDSHSGLTEPCTRRKVRSKSKSYLIKVEIITSKSSYDIEE